MFSYCIIFFLNRRKIHIPYDGIWGLHDLIPAYLFCVSLYCSLIHAKYLRSPNCTLSCCLSALPPDSVSTFSYWKIQLAHTLNKLFPTFGVNCSFPWKFCNLQILQFTKGQYFTCFMLISYTHAVISLSFGSCLVMYVFVAWSTVPNIG